MGAAGVDGSGGSDADARPRRTKRFYDIVIRTVGVAWTVGAFPFLLLLLTVGSA